MPWETDRPGFRHEIAALSESQDVISSFSPSAQQNYAHPKPQYLRKFMGVEPDEKPAQYQEGAPVTWVARHTPPMLLLHGADDREVLPEQSVEMAKRLEANGLDADLYVAPGKEHRDYFFFTSKDFKFTVLYLESWLNRHFRGDTALHQLAR